jgi:fumarate hydratase subunit alpha
MRRIISADKIGKIVSDLCIQANTILRKDVLEAIKYALGKENDKRAKKILEMILKNASIAKREKIAICQDTGLPLVFLDIGRDIKIRGDLNKAVNEGVVSGYKKGYLRDSVISDPILREGKSKFGPPIIHTELIKRDFIRITVLVQGFGCENKTQLKMFNPTVDLEDIKRFIIDTVRSTGPDACPPYIVGIGIGGTSDYACFLAKKALLRKIQNSKFEMQNKSNSKISKLERDLWIKINKLKIGPMGLGGRTTCLGVNIETYPTHIAGLPVAVNISCHALRSATKIL